MFRRVLFINDRKSWSPTLVIGKGNRMLLQTMGCLLLSVLNNTNLNFYKLNKH